MKDSPIIFEIQIPQPHISIILCFFGHIFSGVWRPAWNVECLQNRHYKVGPYEL